jgi:hypothetical protein
MINPAFAEPSHPHHYNSLSQIITRPPDSLQIDSEKDDSFTFGTGVSFFVDSESSAPGRSLLGYYASFSIDKKIFKNFLIKSGIDGYTVPRSNTRLIGTINLNLVYIVATSDKITMSLGTGMFTGFIQRKNSSGITSGGLVSLIVKYKINNSYDVGVNVKYPFFTEVSGVILSNAFVTF